MLEKTRGRGGRHKESMMKLCSLNLHICMQYSGEGTGDPCQYSYLENPMDRGAW